MEEKYFCRTCKGLRNHKEIHAKKTRGDDGDGYFQWIENFSIIECLGCNTVSFLKMYGDTTMIKSDEDGNPDYYFENIIYPFYLEQSNELGYLRHLPPSIRLIYSETIVSLKSNLNILTAGGLRAIIEAICNHLKIRNGNLEERIDLLYKKGHLTLSESKRLHSIRFLGNDALHEMEKPKKEHLYILLDIVNHLLSNLFINDKIIKGKIETIIDSYEEFLKLVLNKINKDMLDQELTLNQILNKSKRLINKNSFLDFEKKFIEEIKSESHDFITIIENNNEITYKIIKQPEFTFNW
jgi:hypothetical protein